MLNSKFPARGEAPAVSEARSLERRQRRQIPNSNHGLATFPLLIIGAVVVVGIVVLATTGVGQNLLTGPRPGTIGTLSATSTSSSQINLSWTSSGAISGYEAGRSFEVTTGFIKITTTTNTSYSDTGLASSTTYYYRVRPFRLDRKGTPTYGSYSNIASATTQSGQILPPPPPPPLTGSCTVSPVSILVGASSTWTAERSGGTGTYTYSWSGTDNLSGFNRVVTKSYTTAGIKTATVAITSGTETKTVPCSNSLLVETPPTPTSTISIGVDASTTLAGVSGAPHALVRLNGDLFMLLQSSPAKLIRFNDPLGNLSDYNVFTWPNDTLHDIGMDMEVINGLLYAIFANPSRKTVISTIDPVTLVTADVLVDSTKWLNNGALATNGTSLYVGYQNITPSIIRKYNPNTWVIEAEGSLPDRGLHALTFAGLSLYATHNTLPGIIVKLNADTLAQEAMYTFESGYNFPTDDLAPPLGGGVFIGFDSASGTVVRVNDSTLGTPVYIPTGTTGGTYGTFAIGNKIWVAANESNSRAHLVLIEPDVPYTTTSFDFSPEWLGINELVGEGSIIPGSFLWASFFTEPAGLMRLKIL